MRDVRGCYWMRLGRQYLYGSDSDNDSDDQVCAQRLERCALSHMTLSRLYYSFACPQATLTRASNPPAAASSPKAADQIIAKR